MISINTERFLREETPLSDKSIMRHYGWKLEGDKFRTKIRETF